MSFQKTALRKGNLPQAFHGPNKQYFFLMDSLPPNFSYSSQIRFIIQKKERTPPNTQKQSLFLPTLIMQKVNETSQRNEACWLPRASRWAALTWEVMAIRELAGLAVLNPQSQLLLAAF